MIYEKQYGEDVKLLISVSNITRLVIDAVVKYNDSVSWKQHLNLGYIMGGKVIHCSTCFNGNDWELNSHIAHAQSDAFYVHGNCIDDVSIANLRLISK